MFGNKEMRKEKRIIRFSFLLFAKTKEIERKIQVFNFYAHTIECKRWMKDMGKNVILGHKKLNM